MKRVKCCDAEWVVDSSSVLSVLGTRTALVMCLWENIADCCKCCCGISVWLEPLCLNVGKKLSAGDRLVPWWMGCAHVNSSVLLQLCSEQHLSVHHLLPTSVPRWALGALCPRTPAVKQVPLKQLSVQDACGCGAAGSMEWGKERGWGEAFKPRVPC